MSTLRQRTTQAWSKARPDLDTTPMVVVGLVKEIAASLELSVEQVYADAGVTTTEVALLVALRHSDGITAIRLAESLSMTRAGVSKALKALESRKMLTRTVNPHDHRSALIELTDCGRRLIDDVFAEELRVHKELLANLGESYDQAIATLCTLADAVTLNERTFD
ncbi:MarR family winged helix-turn-helix transcriptional regulator [Rhodococcus sp. MSC1_016]|jgi:DNA-binding MarR family transcriptional regulator|uniref:MarR family winged helix-turn-helix transcriptional regulator n=1 Tax=Rhodococcus sp. MSC1_016 TaxID=2909266 RepID=UPI00202DD613|nr:MarR family transcriptional regulator [Rhodococcus sp. MSC1_016]